MITKQEADEFRKKLFAVSIETSIGFGQGFYAGLNRASSIFAQMVSTSKGHWVYKEHYDENNKVDQRYMICSECGFFWSERKHVYNFKYCPHCGIEMDGAIDE